MSLIHKIMAYSLINVSVSAGKDSEAMGIFLKENNIPVHKYIHCDLGKVEWPESMGHCCAIVARLKGSLKILRRNDGLGLLELWKRRMHKLKGTGKPFWSSSQSRYCTSDSKRGPSDNYFRTLPTDRIIISAEGLRWDESKERGKKKEWTIRKNGLTSSYYKGMTVEEAVRNFKPGKRLALNWYPILDASEKDVYELCGQSLELLEKARKIYAKFKVVPKWWTMHRAYVYGNKRVSCRFCVLGCISDLQTAARESTDDLLEEMKGMEIEGNATFKNGWSLTQLKVA